MEQNINHTRELRLQNEAIQVMLFYTKGDATLQERMIEILRKRMIKHHKNRENSQYLL